MVTKKPPAKAPAKVAPVKRRTPKPKAEQTINVSVAAPTPVKAETKKPTFDYNADKDSLWQLYNGITLSLQKSHPKTWMDQQRMIHWLVMSDYTGLGLVGEMKEAKVNLTPSNQLNLLDMIAEAETEVEQLYVNDNNQY